MNVEIRIIPISGIGEIPTGSDLGAIIFHAMQAHHLALADIENGSERGDSRDVMHDDSTGEIFHAPFRQQAAAPNHVDKREVD